MAGFRHAMADIDYGYRVSDYGIPVLIAPGFLGLCAANSRRGTWEDTNLNMSERLKKTKSIKGLPAGDWWRFCRRNGGWAPHSILSLRSSACWRVGNEQELFIFMNNPLPIAPETANVVMLAHICRCILSAPCGNWPKKWAASPWCSPSRWTLP